MTTSIEEFYKFNNVDESFNEKLYLEIHPETAGFYQPYCQQNNIDDKHRLYFHYRNYFNTKVSEQETVYDKSNPFNNIYEIESKWQEPNSTELHYLNNHKRNFCSKDSIYIACAWASVIDAKIRIDKSIIEEISLIKKKKVTICQHIGWKNLLDLWYNMGIDDAYVSHCTKNLDIYYPNIKTWPLYASSVHNFNQPNINNKKYLASFVGCHRRDYRSKIRLLLNNYFHKNKHPDIYFQLNDDWFYEKNIYHNEPISTEQLNQTSLYNQIIIDSVFSLCPEGTGPNTIRLWESMALGSIPVIYSDDWLPPQIPEMNWADFSIFIPIKEYENTLDILTSIDQDKIKVMQSNCVVAFNKFHNMTCWSF